MTKTKKQNRTVILSSIILVICIAVGLFAWFNCSSSYKIQADELKMDLLLKDENNNWKLINLFDVKDTTEQRFQKFWKKCLTNRST